MRYVVASLLVLLLAIGCEDDDDSRTVLDTKFVFMTRGVEGAEGQFAAVTRDTAVIRLAREELAKPIDDRHLFPNGPIVRGGGTEYGWSWHFAPNQWELVESAIELCDGTPAMVEADLDYWVDTVGQFCPWSAYVVQEIRPQPD